MTLPLESHDKEHCKQVDVEQFRNDVQAFDCVTFSNGHLDAQPVMSE
jgi:hypothetical protein